MRLPTPPPPPPLGVGVGVGLEGVVFGLHWLCQPFPQYLVVVLHHPITQKYNNKFMLSVSIFAKFT